MKTPLISVIVPIYKIDRYLGVCIESILNQTYTNLEVVLVDDGSPDRCPEICDLYAKKDARIKVIHKLNGGLVSARKAGILSATGKYIGYVDGDDWIGPGFYYSLYASIQESEADVAIAGFSRDLFSKRKNILNGVMSGVYSGDALEELKSKMISNGDFFSYGITTYLWNKLFRREVLLPHQLACHDSITIGEDAAVTYTTLMDCKKVVVTDNCAYHYRQREDSMLKQTSDYCEEFKRLHELYDCMTTELKGYPGKYNLNRQVDDLVLSTYIIRSGGSLKCEDSDLAFFPFGEDINGKNIVVYGAGTFGQHLVHRLRNESKCNLVAWIDDDYWEYRRCCMNVDPIETINSSQVDKILIAKLSNGAIDEIKNVLSNYGISESKIVPVFVDPGLKQRALEIYLQQSNGSLWG